MSVSDTLAERGSRYGEFADHARIAQGIQDVMREAPRWQLLDSDMKQALSVIADKIARILNGDPFYGDNWHDIQGYALLVENRIKMLDTPEETLYATGGPVDSSQTYIVGEQPSESYLYKNPALLEGGVTRISS